MFKFYCIALLEFQVLIKRLTEAGRQRICLHMQPYRAKDVGVGLSAWAILCILRHKPGGK
jgi:hypothetical protein